jgi:hypothetical protein
MEYWNLKGNIYVTRQRAIYFRYRTGSKPLETAAEKLEAKDGTTEGVASLRVAGKYFADNAGFLADANAEDINSFADLVPARLMRLPVYHLDGSPVDPARVPFSSPVSRDRDPA